MCVNTAIIPVGHNEIPDARTFHYITTNNRMAQMEEGAEGEGGKKCMPTKNQMMTTGTKNVSK